MTYEQRQENLPLASYVEQFIQERRFLKGVSPKTLEWYKYSFKAFAPVLTTSFEASTTLKAGIIKRIGELQQTGRGNKAVSINTYLRCLKTFLLWCHTEGIVKERVKLSWLKEEDKILATFSPEQIKRIVNWKPVRRSDARLHTLVLTAIDTGLRVEELVSLSRSDVDFEHLTLRVVGKGNKHRLVPMSVELRKILWRHLSKHQFPRVFSTLQGAKLSKRNLLRDFKELCTTIGISGVRCSLHTLRHSFAVNYLRNGGNLYMLQRILGHSSIVTTERYIRSLGIEDIVKEHSSRSLLALL